MKRIDKWLQEKDKQIRKVYNKYKKQGASNELIQAILYERANETGIIYEIQTQRLKEMLKLVDFQEKKAIID